MDWVVGKVGWDGFIKWLYGPAGAGKSAIAQTIAEMCHSRRLLLASFFFSRTDPKRNNEKWLIASIAYQIALNAPVTRDAIEAAVDNDPAIFQCSIEAQLTTLIINPLTQLSKTGHKIARTHPLKAYIHSTWPTNDVLSALVHKSSGQFIFAATVVKYLSSNRHQPTRRLEIILDMQPSRNDRPFAELDTLYMGILSYVEDVKVTLRLLGVLILCDLSPKTPTVVGEFMFLDPDEVERLLLDLAFVVECPGMHTPIRMLHASFPDFLFDQSRSGEYYIDASMMHAEIAQHWLSHIEVHESEDCVTCLGRFYCETLNYALCIIQHLSQAEPSADLREALLNTCYITVLIKLETFRFPSRVSDLLAEFLFFLKSSKFTDTEDPYLYHRNIYDRIMRKRVADLPLDFGSIVGLVLAGLHPTIRLLKFNQYFTDYFPAVKGGLSLIYTTLYFLPLPHFSGSDYVILLTEFLTDPGRAGEHALDGPKCALVAKFLLDCFIPPCSEGNFLRYFGLSECSDLLIVTGTLLSKASHSDELVTRINQTEMNCEFTTSKRTFIGLELSESQESLRMLSKGTGDYLTRVVGSVPTDLKITLRVYDKMLSVKNTKKFQTLLAF